MVYYGAVSTGCQRCRQRKIKCDQRKPGCLRCEKSKTKCPGFRNLANVVFRDESERIIRNARTFYGESHIEQPIQPMTQDAMIHKVSTDLPSRSASPISQIHGVQRSDSKPISALPPSSIIYSLSPPVHELGANFFFVNYSCNDEFLSKEFSAWLGKMYFEANPGHALRAAIEALGIAGISSSFHAPHIASKSKVQYGRALAATKKLLSDPVELTADTTLTTVILLGHFEVLTCEDWDQYRSWATHIIGATTLLQLRGQEQFNHERGAQLYIQLRSQLLWACAQQDIAVPQAFVQIDRKFKASAIGKRRKKIYSDSLNDICFRLVRLRTEIKTGDITDPHTIHKAAHEIDNNLEAWRDSLGSHWSYTTIDAGNAPANIYFDGKRHVYSDIRTAHAWASWRTLRILVNGIMIQNEKGSDASGSAQNATSLTLIHQLSNEICISAPNFMGSPRAAAIIWPLFVVSKESLNPLNQRCWALEQLRHLDSTLGIRQAGFLADGISQDLNGS